MRRDHHGSRSPTHLEDQGDQSLRELETATTDLYNLVGAVIEVFAHIKVEDVVIMRGGVVKPLRSIRVQPSLILNLVQSHPQSIFKKKIVSLDMN